MIDTAIRRMIAGAAIAAAAVLASCGPKSQVDVANAGGPSPGDVSIGGMVSGLTGTVVLQNNGGESLRIPASGSFTFLTPVASGAQYGVAVSAQPSGQTCTVTNGAGIASGASITSVNVTCATNTFSVGITVSGLTGTAVLQLNGGNNLSVSANGSFTFNTPLADRSSYSVTVLTQPSGQACSVADGTGTIAGANVASVAVSCATNRFSVGGAVSGLSGTLVLQNNGTDNLTVQSGSSFTFATALQFGTSYSVTVLTQPARQICSVVNGNGTVSGGVTSVSVTCTPKTFSVGGTVSGLAGTLVLQNNGTNNLTKTGNGVFTFSSLLQSGSNYNVAVLTQPAGQTCTVANGAGTVSSADVVSVAVTCATNTFRVGVTVSGLTGTAVLQLNGGGNLSVSANGSFIFGVRPADLSSYSVTVLTHPAGQTCSVANGTGTIAGADITDVGVSCAANRFSVGGTVSGLGGTLVLQNNGTDNLSVSSGGFTFATALQTGSPYSVAVLTQPAGQTCTVANASGTVGGANVTNVSVSCAVNTFTVGGTASGVSGTLVLRNNGTNNLAITADGAFAFSVALQPGSAYNVTVGTQPAGQTCTVANGTGTVGGANVTSVAVTCATNTFTVGGGVSGLAGTVVLQLNGGSDLGVSASGPFTFNASLLDGNGYNVTVLTQPPGQSCSVSNGTGAVSGASITSVGVSCVANTFTVSGNVFGLAGSVALQLNGGSIVTLSASGAFSFPDPVSNNARYTVAVLTQPVGQSCSVANGAGTIAGANVGNVSVTCATNTFGVGGTVSGLTGTVVLQINGGGSLSVSANGPFAFAGQFADRSSYSVTILSQPAGQGCSITGGTGTIAGANVTNVSVSCAVNTFSVGGAVSGLSGTLVLQNNGGNNLAIGVNGAFAFSTAIQTGSTYNVTVLTQPASQTCTVTNGAGTVSGANVASVAVTCATNTFSVGGTLSGVTTGTVVLQVNGVNNLSLSASGPFTFNTPLADRSSYSVTVLTPPVGQSCSVANGTGTLAGTNVANVSVSCAANTFTVGGAVSGLSGTLVLQNNGANNLSVAVNGPFVFSTALQTGSGYSVTVLTQPSGQTCSVANATGTVSGANVANVSVSCVVNTFSVGGTVSGLSGSVVLQNNGANNLTTTANGSFVFSTALPTGSAYSVAVLTQPAGQSCTVANGTGTVSGANVASVNVSCAVNTFTVGGTVSGLSGTLVLKNNGANNLSISGNVSFSFSTALADGSAYNVTVGTQPAGQTCTVSNGTGTVNGANVTSVGVACAANAGTITYTTNFAGIESPISENGAWHHTGFDWTRVAKANGFAHGTQTGNGDYDDSYAYLSGFPANQSASATIVLNTNATDLESREVELLLRWSDSAHSATGYEINLHYRGGYAQIVRWDGPFGGFTILTGAFDPPRPKTGDVIKATMVGNVITVFYNGVQIMQATDSTYSTGNPGMGFFIRSPAHNTDFGVSSFTASGL